MIVIKMPTGIYKHNPNQGFQKGHISFLTDESCRKISLSNSGKKHPWILKGEKNPCWKGGKPKCIDCGKQLKYYHQERCKECFYKQNIGEKQKLWKGEKVSYRNLHRWVIQWLGKPTKCEICGKDGLIGKHIHWANIDHQYKRNLADWIRLCVSCHKIYDFKLF